MRFSSCFGNQSPSHRDTRLSPHPGKFQHIFAKNAKMLAKNTFESTFVIIVFFFVCFGLVVYSYRDTLNLWDQGWKERALVLPGVWTNHNSKSCFQKFFLFQELKLGPRNPRLLRFLAWSHLSFDALFPKWLFWLLLSFWLLTADPVGEGRAKV